MLDAMEGDKRMDHAVFAEVAAALGMPDAAALGTLGLDGLRKLSYRQLIESSRRLGLQGISRLNKDALAERLWGVLEQSGAFVKPVVEQAGHAVLSHKFEVGERGEPAHETRAIPWSYGWDRVTGMAVDPDSLYAYWEVADDAIKRARQRLGAGGEGAWLNVRVYDTTGRIFDGTNAHSYFDHKVERGDRQWFFSIGKPSSEAVVEVGMRSHEGFFVKIARSGRVEFPRREPTAWSDPEWLTVRASGGEVEHAGRGAPGGQDASPPPGSAGGSSGFEQVPLWQMRRAPWEESMRFFEAGGGERVEWEEFFGEGAFEAHRMFTWEGPITISSWEAGPFTYPVEAPAPEQESFVGSTRVYRSGGRTHVVHGPWQVVIRGLGAHYGRAVISRWEIHRSWVAGEGREVRSVSYGTVTKPGSSELVAVGASERRWLGASDVKVRGSSELFYVGASERRLGGASETLYAGASEWMTRGSSERRLLGASELRLAGASENLYRGASELQYAGASERLRLGASEQRHAGTDAVGASEERLDAGENAYPKLPPNATSDSNR